MVFCCGAPIMLCVGVGLGLCLWVGVVYCPSQQYRSTLHFLGLACCRLGGGGGVWRVRYFCINYPELNPGFTLPRGAPKSAGVDRKPSLCNVCITHVLANKQFVPHKCGHQYIHHNYAPGTYHKL